MNDQAARDRSDAGDISEAFAQEALKQAQKLVESQISASNALDSKLMSVMNASIGLTGAALAAAALAIPQSRNAWLPLWAAFGFLGSAAAWMVAASVSAWGLRAAELAAPALQPSKLIAAQLHKQPLPTTLMAIAWTLDDASQANGKSARRVSRCLAMSLGCMLAALPIGAVACLLAYYWPHTGWIIPPAIVLSGGLFFQRLMTRRP